MKLDDDERKVLDSPPLQRLRHIHQLALTYLVYPGATHKRFEHSLGVMELASRIFDVITNPDNLIREVRKLLPINKKSFDRKYWKQVVRMAALCHDIGHLPFSHAAEAALLPKEWNHERLTRKLILSKSMLKLWQKLNPPLNPEHIVKLALGKREAKDLDFSYWEEILAEIIVGDAFGADRIDYLLRDSYHAGVAYGRFDHYRLIDTLRILPKAPEGEKGESREPVLGVEEGGLKSAEALMMARYFMYTQVYLHPIRRIYDIHLRDFLKEWLPNGIFSTSLIKHLSLTDNEINSALVQTAKDSRQKGHKHAERIIRRKHFKLLPDPSPSDLSKYHKAGEIIFKNACEKFGEDCLRYDHYSKVGEAPNFPVLMRGGRIDSSLSLSKVLQQIPGIATDYIFVAREKETKVKSWLLKNKDIIISSDLEKENPNNGKSV